MLLPPQTTRMKFQPSLYPQTHTDFSGWAAFSIVEIPQFWMTSVQNIPHTGVRPLRETDLWVTGWRKYRLFTLKEGWAYRFWWSTRFDWEVGLDWSLPLPQTFSFITDHFISGPVECSGKILTSIALGIQLNCLKNTVYLMIPHWKWYLLSDPRSVRACVSDARQQWRGWG